MSVCPREQDGWFQRLTRPDIQFTRGKLGPHLILPLTLPAD
jgi:hypothetical protein